MIVIIALLIFIAWLQLNSIRIQLCKEYDAIYRKFDNCCKSFNRIQHELNCRGFCGQCHPLKIQVGIQEVLDIDQYLGANYLRLNTLGLTEPFLYIREYGFKCDGEQISLSDSKSIDLKEFESKVSDAGWYCNYLAKHSAERLWSLSNSTIGSFYVLYLLSSDRIASQQLLIGEISGKAMDEYSKVRRKS